MPGFSPTITTDAALGWPRPLVALIPGVREWLLLALVVVALFGRAGLTRPARAVARWGSVARRRSRQPAGRLRWLTDRWFVAVVCLAGIGVAAWVLMAWRVARGGQAP